MAGTVRKHGKVCVYRLPSAVEISLRKILVEKVGKE
jgi:hypothetical protein